MDVTLVDYLKEVGISKMRIRPEGFGITAAELAEREGVSFAVAIRLLETGIASGALAKEKMHVGKSGAHPYVYFRPIDKDKLST